MKLRKSVKITVYFLSDTLDLKRNFYVKVNQKTTKLHQSRVGNQSNLNDSMITCQKNMLNLMAS